MKDRNIKNKKETQNQKNRYQALRTGDKKLKGPDRPST